MKFKINEIEWEIFEVDGTNTMLTVNDRYCRGTCVYKECHIYLDKSLKRDVKQNTLIHELTHCFLSCCLLLQKESYNEEEVCEFVSIYAPQILRIAEAYFEKGNK